MVVSNTQKIIEIAGYVEFKRWDTENNSMHLSIINYERHQGYVVADNAKARELVFHLHRNVKARGKLRHSIHTMKPLFIVHDYEICQLFTQETATNIIKQMET